MKRLVAQAAFVLSGLVLILLNQYLADCGVNSPFAGFNAAAKGIGFLVCALVWRCCCCCCSESRFDAAPRLPQIVRLALPVALFDVCDTIFATGGIVWAKSGLFVIAFSSLTVWVALLRKLCLKKKQAWTKWLAVVLISAAIAASGVQSVDGKEFDTLTMMGILATLVAAFADASMYICVEKAIKPAKNKERSVNRCDEGYAQILDKEDEEDKEQEGGTAVAAVAADNDDEIVQVEQFLVTPFEMTVFVGVVSTAFSVVWLGVVWLGGFWSQIVVPIAGCGWAHNRNGTTWTGAAGSNDPKQHHNINTLFFVMLWAVQAIVGYGVHYIAFFYMVRHENCLNASISKACQSALIFFMSSVFFCERSQSQCLTVVKEISAVVVCLCVLLYAMPVRRGSRHC